MPKLKRGAIKRNLKKEELHIKRIIDNYKKKQKERKKVRRSRLVWNKKWNIERRAECGKNLNVQF